MRLEADHARPFIRFFSSHTLPSPLSPPSPPAPLDTIAFAPRPQNSKCVGSPSPPFLGGPAELRRRKRERERGGAESWSSWPGKQRLGDCPSLEGGKGQTDRDRRRAQAAADQALPLVGAHRSVPFSRLSPSPCLLSPSRPATPSLPRKKGTAGERKLLHEGAVVTGRRFAESPSFADCLAWSLPAGAAFSHKLMLPRNGAPSASSTSAYSAGAMPKQNQRLQLWGSQCVIHRYSKLRVKSSS